MSSKQIKKIGIAGAGGLGSHLVHFLFDFGANREQFPWTEMEVDLYDDESVDKSNLLHQNYTLDDLGKQKAKILADKYLVNPVLRFMGEDKDGKLKEDDFSKYDFIFSCVDGMKFRTALYNWSWNNPGKLTWIDGRCNSRNIAIYNSAIPKEKLEKTLSKETERKGCLRPVDKENKISHTTPIVIASIMTQLFLDYLRGDMPAEEIVLML